MSEAGKSDKQQLETLQLDARVVSLRSSETLNVHQYVTICLELL